MSCLNCPNTTTLQPNLIQKSDISNNVGEFSGGGFIRNPFTTENACSGSQTAFTGRVGTNNNYTSFYTCASNVDEAYANFQNANQNNPNAYTFQWSQSNYMSTSTATSATKNASGYTTNACLYGSGPVNAIQFSYSPSSSTIQNQLQNCSTNPFPCPLGSYCDPHQDIFVFENKE